MLKPPEADVATAASLTGAGISPGDRGSAAALSPGSAAAQIVWRRAIVGVALIAIVLGVFTRLDSLDRKVLWFDESFSLLRISGHSQDAMYELFDGKVHSSDQLLALQQVTPKLGLDATLASLHEEPQRGPLYYVLARLWIGFAGNATSAVRGLSVLLGFIGIGLGFLVGRRLAHSTEGGFVLAAMIALSPIEIRFSQQVREYILVADLTLLSVLLLLRALERPDAVRWVAYGLCVLAGLYTNTTFLFLMFAQGIVAVWLALSGHVRKGATIVGVAAAAGAAVLLYAPWAYAASRTATRHSIDLAWAAGAYPLRTTLLKWAFNAGAVFFDSEYAHNAWGIVLLPLLAIAVLAVVRAFARGPNAPSHVLALAVTFSTLVPIVALDFLRHAHYELVARYQMPTWLGVSMLVTLLVVPGLRAVTTRRRARSAVALAVVLVAGGTSAIVDRPFTEWWDNNDHFSESAVADVVRAGPHPALVIASDSADNAYDTFVLSRYLPAGTPMLLFGDRLPALPRGYAATYFFTPSRSELADALARTGVAPHNVSPSAGLKIPELNAARAASAETVVADNALWESLPQRP